MGRKKRDFLIGFLSLADLVVLIVMASSSPTEVEKVLIYSFDILVVVLIAFTFCIKMKESKQMGKYVLKNWYEIPGIIPIVIFALAGQGSNIYDGFITMGVMLRLLAIMYFIRLSRSLEDKSRILGGHVLLQIFILFFLTLVILSFLFYSVEHSIPNSEITSMGDALWWTIQVASTASFGPNVITPEGRIVGSFIMLVGIGITISFISTMAAALTRSGTRVTPTEIDPKLLLKIRLAKGEITKESYLDLLKSLSE